MITVEEAERLIAQHAPSYEAETVPIGDAHGGVLREDIRTDRDLPPFNRATMDGIAISLAAWSKGVRCFHIEGTQKAGYDAIVLRDTDADCIQIMTGAVMPGGCDGVIPFEQVEIRNGVANVLPDAQFERHQHVHRQGTDRKAGALLLAAGARLGGPQIAIVVSAGKTNVSISRKPSVAVVSIGDELIAPGASAKPYQIYPSNAFGIAAALRDFGLSHVQMVHLKDDLADMQTRIAGALADTDVMILSGGVSRGTYDFVPEALERNGVQKIFHMVSQRPGKPLWFGMSRRGAPVFALPGNPVSTLVCLRRYVLPQLAVSMGAARPAPLTARLAKDQKTSGVLTHFLPVRIRPNEDGGLDAQPEEYHGSGDYAALGPSTGFIELPKNQTFYPAGSVVAYYPWRI